MVVLTHPQRDHIGGAAEVLERLRVGAVLDPAIPSESVEQGAALEAARRRRIRVVVARAGEGFRIGRLRLRVLWPEGPGRREHDPNDHAIVLLASYGEIDALLTADAESGVTRRLHVPPVEILKVAHHGSDDPGLPELLEQIHPRVAVISVGARQRLWASDRVDDRVARRGARARRLSHRSGWSRGRRVGRRGDDCPE